MSWHAKRFEPHPTKVAVTCTVCQRPFYLPKCKVGRYVTCGKECNDKMWAAQREERGRNCLICSKRFYPRSTQITAGQGKYCSTKCRSLQPLDHLFTPEVVARGLANRRYKTGPDHPGWKGGFGATYVRSLAAGTYARANQRRRERMATAEKVPMSCLFINRFVEQNGECAMCGQELTDYEFDHIFPLAAGGEHKWDNLCLLCPKCNRRKGARHPDAFKWAHKR